MPKARFLIVIYIHSRTVVQANEYGVYPLGPRHPAHQIEFKPLRLIR
jgi:hypothetical protein